MRALCLAVLASGCTAIAPFGELVTGDGGGQRDSGPAPTCGDAGPFTYDAGPPVDAGAGVEACNRRDDDGDYRVDENLLSAAAARVVPGVDGVGDRLRASEGLRPDTVFAAFVSTASATRGRLRVAEARIGGDAREVVVGEGAVTAFDVATAVDSYVVAWSEAGEVRLARVEDCGVVGSTVTLASGEATHVRLATSADGSEAYVVWVDAAGAVHGARVDVRGAPAAGPVGVLDAATHVEAAVAVGASSGWVAVIERRTAGDVVVLRSLGRDGTFGLGVDVDSASLVGTGPLQNVNVVIDPEDFMILSFDLGDGVTMGPGYAQEIRLPELRLQAARRYGGEALVLDSANDGSASSGLLLRLGGDFAVERVGANDDGFLSTDESGEVPSLTRSGWLALVGFREGPFRFAAVGRDAAGALSIQAVLCE